MSWSEETNPPPPKAVLSFAETPAMAIERGLKMNSSSGVGALGAVFEKRLQGIRVATKTALGAGFLEFTRPWLR